MREERRAYNIFRMGIFGGSLVLAVATFFTSTYNHEAWRHALFFFIMAAACEAVPIHMNQRGEIVLTFLVVWATMLLCPPFIVMLVPFAAVCVISGSRWLCARMHHKYVSNPVSRWKRLATIRRIVLRDIARTLAFDWVDRHNYPLRHVLSYIQLNASSMAICAGVAALVYSAVGGVPLLVGEGLDVSLLHTLLPLVTAVMVYFVLDTAIFSATYVFWENRPDYTHSWRSWFLRWRMLMLETVVPSATSYVFIFVFALTLAWLYAKNGPLVVAALVLPVYFIGHSLKQTAQMEQAYRETITALGTYIQLYHPYTRGHLKRVAELSERLARELNLPAESVRWMPDAGLLHDIGKVGVSEEILDKPGRPTEEEWAKIQEHPVKGAEIVAQMEFLDAIVDWVKYHHKWYDGSGYPQDGRNGDVPIEAHIIAVADAFDAMTDDREMTLSWTCDSCGFSPENGDRPSVCPSCGAEKSRRYRKPLSLDQAMDELRRGAGTQFRPEVVKAFLRMIHREGVHIGGSA